MSPENPRGSLIENVPNPFRRDGHHDIIFRSAQRALEEAGESIRTYWSSFIDKGVGDVMSEAQFTKRPRVFEGTDENGARIIFMVRFRGLTIDQLTFQPINHFEFVQPEPSNNNQPDKITILTNRPERGPYGDLVGLTAESEGENLFHHHFHFIGKKLVLVNQIGQPESLFESGDKDHDQFARIQHGAVPSELVGLFQAQFGLVEGDTSDQHNYQYIGGGLAKSRNIRIINVLGGSVELVSIKENGTIYTSQEFSIPQAILNIANFEPATQAKGL